MAEQTLNIPQILVFLAITVLVARWWLKPGAANPPTSAANRRANPAHIEQLAQMFPQLERRTIAWNLQKNGGNVQAITETVLGGRTLEQPPVSFQLPPPRTVIPTGAQQQPAARPSPRPAQPNLIDRYNLASKIGQEPKTSVEEQPKPSKSWSQDKSERQANLQRRRDEMILAARRKMAEKARAEQQTE